MTRRAENIRNWLAKRLKNKVLVAYEENCVQEGTTGEPGKVYMVLIRHGG